MASDKKTRRKHERIPVSQEQLRKTQAIVDVSLKDNPDMFNLPVSKHSVELLTDYFCQDESRHYSHITERETPLCYLLSQVYRRRK